MSWANREVKDLKEIHEKKSKDNESAFMAELKVLDDHYADRLLSFRAYGEKLYQLREKYKYVKPEQLTSAYSSFDKQNKGNIKYATNELYKVNPQVEQAKKDKEYAQKNLNEINSVDMTGVTDEKKLKDHQRDKTDAEGLVFDTQSTYDQLLKKKQGFEDSLLEFEKKGDTTSAEYKKAKDESEKARADMMDKFYKDDMANRKAIEEKAFEGVKTILDREYELRLQQLARVKAVIDEQYSNEEAAVNKSSLSAKDKAALDIQLAAQKQQYDKNAALEERKLKREQAVADRALNIAHIVWNTEESISAALKMPAPYGEILAAERGVLGAIEVATVLATPIPYAEGTPYGGHPGGLARYGESGPEIVKEPYKSPYIVMTDTVSYLPKGTEVTPILESPEFGMAKVSDGWEQTRWLAKQMSKNNKPNKNVVNTTINLGLGFEIYKKQILGN